MVAIIKFLAWIILAMAVLATCCIILEIRAKREVYKILEKNCLFMLGIIGLIVEILGLIAK